jgi:hypothetical protein
MTEVRSRIVRLAEPRPESATSTKWFLAPRVRATQTCGHGRAHTALTPRVGSVTANQGEDGILDVCELLISRGVGIEAGLLSVDDARRFVAAGIAPRCTRAMVEPLDADPADAVADAEAIEYTLLEAGITL